MSLANLSGAMELHARTFCIGVFVSVPSFATEQAVAEGRVELPNPHAAPVVNQRYQIVTKGGIVATDPAVAVVYLAGQFPQRVSAQRPQMAQKDLEFVTAAQVGTTVKFPNLDDTYHNIFSCSQPKRFDLGPVSFR